MLIPALRELAAITGCQLAEPTPAAKVKLEPTVGKVQAPNEAKPGSRKRRKRDKDTSTPRTLKPTSCSSTAARQRDVLDEDVVDLRLPHERTLHPEDRSPEAGRSGRLDDFVACYNPDNRHERKESERFKCFAYDDLLKRDKVSLDIFWLKDESLEDSANLSDPDVIAAEIAEDLQAALDQFAQIAGDLSQRAGT